MLTYIIDGWRRMSTLRKIRRVFMLALLGLGIWALTPYFFSRQVNEAFPALEAGLAADSAAPRALLRGSFTRVDAIHAAEGTATIYRLPDGGLVLRFEDFTSTNGPDLFVGLSGHPIPRNPIELRERGYQQFEKLKANEGNQNYDLPPSIQPEQFKSVVIFCQSFQVVFSTAELAPAT